MQAVRGPDACKEASTRLRETSSHRMRLWAFGVGGAPCAGRARARASPARGRAGAPPGKEADIELDADDARGAGKGGVAREAVEWAVGARPFRAVAYSPAMGLSGTRLPEQYGQYDSFAAARWCTGMSKTWLHESPCHQARLELPGCADSE